MLNDLLDLTGFNKLPTFAKTGVVVGVGAVGAAAIYFLRDAVGLLIVGVIIILLLIVAFELFRRYKIKKEGKSFSESLKSMLKLQPRTASAEERSRLEQMREKFEEGIEKFRSAGRSVYDVPWFVLIGEPGSGKTEAIRRSNIAFPPGLQDRFQGAGGTVNMDWWFTNDAVIIDTAGRIIVEEVAAGEVAEWDQLLTMLKSQRKKCPINGVVMMLPAAAPPVEPGQQPATGGLLDDSPDQIEKRATRFVERLGRLQQRLGVRFPVFIVVTMCDRVLGFREFFDDLTDVEQQHQMLGWSNPAPLDDAYNAGAIEEALGAISNRLRQRRLELLRDPVHTEDAQKNRADQVDKLYAFPEAFDSIAPNLRAYLDRLFTKTAWYQPPFLRGVFFTSSMQKGAAIDNALADLVGAEADAVSGGGVFRADRAYFLKDVIEKKVFEEKGLVTDAADAEGARRKARMVMWVAGGAAAALLLTSMAWGVLCSLNWQRNNLNPWRDARDAYFYNDDQERDDQFKENTAALIGPRTGQGPPGYNVSGGDEAGGDGALQVQRSLVGRLGRTDAGFMCRLFGSSFEADTSLAQAMLFARVVSRPTTFFALRQMSGVSEGGGGRDLESEALALAELLRWATLGLGEEPRAVIDARETASLSMGAPEPDVVAFEPIARVVQVRDSEAERWAEDVPQFAEIFGLTAERLRAENDDRYRDWLGFAIGVRADDAYAAEGREALAAATNRVVDRFTASQDDASTFGALTALRESVGRFRAAEQSLWAMGAADAGPTDEQEAMQVQRQWLLRYNEMLAEHERIEALLPQLRAAAGESGLTPAFVAQVVDRRQRTADASFESMLAALPPEPTADANLEPQSDRAWLETLRRRIVRQKESFDSTFAARAQAINADEDRWTEHVGALDASGAYAVDRRFAAYSLAQERLVVGGALEHEVSVPTLFQTLDADSADAERRMSEAIEVLEPVNAAQSPVIKASGENARGSLEYALTLAKALRERAATDQAFAQPLPSAETIAASFPDAVNTFPVPRLSRLNPEGGDALINARFAVEVGRAMAEAYAIARSDLAPTEGSTELRLRSSQTRADILAREAELLDWLDRYANYWEGVLLSATEIADFTDWSEFRGGALPNVRPFDAQADLRDLEAAIDSVIDPLRAIPEEKRGREVNRLLLRVENGKQAEENTLLEYSTGRQIGLVGSYLGTLPQDPLEARSRLLNDLRVGSEPLFEFLRLAELNFSGGEYLLSTRYAIQLVVAASKTLRLDASATLVEQFDDFVQRNRRLFPFADPTAAPVDQMANFQSVDPATLGDFGAVESLISGSSSSESRSPIDGYPMALRTAAADLEDLLGAEKRELAEQVLGLKEALTGPQGGNVNLTCQFILLPRVMNERLPQSVGNIRIQEPGQTNADRSLTPLDPEAYPNRRLNNTPLQVSAAGPVTIDLLRFEGDQNPIRTIELGGWSPLKMLFAFNAQPAAQPFGGAPANAAWNIRIPVDGGEVMLQLVFSQPLPPRAEWPRF